MNFRVIVLWGMMFGALFAQPGLSAPAPIGQQNFFHFHWQAGGWSLIDPQGQRFFIKGVHGIRYIGDNLAGGKASPYHKAVEEQFHSDQGAWARQAVTRIKQWGFNTIGASSDVGLNSRGLPYVILLKLSEGTYVQGGEIPDVFSQSWRDTVSRNISRITPQTIIDKNLIGYFTDNEFNWWGVYKGKVNLLQLYLHLPKAAPGYSKAMEYIVQNHLDAAHISDEDADGFREIVAREYFSYTYKQLKLRDPNHLVLGCRFRTNDVLTPVLRGMRGNVDAVSWNRYGYPIPQGTGTRIREITNLPLIISEFSFAATDSGLGFNVSKAVAGIMVITQHQRSLQLKAYLAEMKQEPNLVGYIWYKYSDNPVQGAWTASGENYNWGLVDNMNKPYSALTQSFKNLNGLYH
ncbi:hypothetical protein [Asticcacaulis benevestitus]|uniref:Beta-agarase n=1 Tax=Asticcacaulis benevestitus DSM 16100 = ATCC BAA-896 TaxID=1121022 RepID=V4PQ36_9CAUL|nr:hypothetical protein [Asticcacaulis benevestitus]ESQ89444.1 hypothetical protein ABENE_13780 [Asticcacaulis benevestitus DSM 16100 = ATCC BAA-896]